MKPHKSIAVAVSLATLLSLGLGGTALADEPTAGQDSQSASSSVKADGKNAADSNTKSDAGSKGTSKSDAPATKPSTTGDASKLPASANAATPAPQQQAQPQDSSKNQPAAPQPSTKDNPATSNDKKVDITVNLTTVDDKDNKIPVPKGLFDTTLHADTVYLDIPNMLGKTAMVDAGNGTKVSVGFIPMSIHFKSVEGEDIETAPGNVQPLVTIDPQAGEPGHTTINGTIAVAGMQDFAYKWYNQEQILKTNIAECNKMLTNDLYYHHADFLKLEKDTGDALDESTYAKLPAADSDPSTWPVTKLNKTLSDDELNTKNTQPTIIWTQFDANADGAIDAKDVTKNPGRYISHVVPAEQDGKPFAGWAKSADAPVEFAPDVAIPIDSLTLKDADTDTYVCDYMPVYRTPAPDAPAAAPAAPSASAADPAASGSANKPAAATKVPARAIKDPSDPGQLGKTGTAVAAIAGVAVLLMAAGTAVVVLRKRAAGRHAAK